MPNQLLLPSQKFNYKEITDQFPSTGNPKKKVFFQAQLRSLANGDATFGIIAYASWKEKGVWKVSPTPVIGIDSGLAIPIPLNTPLAFANNELVLTRKKEKKKKKKASKKGQWNQFEKRICKLYKNKKQIANATLLFKTSISKNPHLEYDVTLEVSGTLFYFQTKPSPPASPE